MKIGISVVTYHPEKNGVQFVTQNLAEGLVKNGHEVYVVTRLYKGTEKKICLNGVKIYRYDIKDKNMFHFGDKAGFQRKILQLSKKVDVMIFVCLQSVATDWALDILDLISCPKIVYMHGMHEFKWKKIDLDSFKDFVYKILRDIRWGIFYAVNRKKIGKFDKFIHLHKEDSAYKFFEKRYPGKNYVLENFAEDMFFRKIDKSEEVSDYFICISNYHSRKNQRLLLRAFYLMKNNFKLIFIGSSDNEYYYDLLEEKKKLDRKYSTKKDIKFLYGIDRKEFPSLLQNAYAYVLTSKWEAFPITIIEALASGTPYISTDVGIVKFLPGGIIATDNAVDIAKKMDWLLENKKAYKNLKKEAIFYANRYFIFENYLEKFEKIVVN